MDIEEFIQLEAHIEELKEYISRPSRSHHSKEVREAGTFAMELMKKAGLTPEMFETSGNPLIIGKNDHKPGNPSILIYGHYDVQPAGDLELWQSDPFSPVIRNGKMWGRGTGDNKGQHYAHLLAMKYINEYEAHLLDNINITLLLDGDEERGSFTLKELFKVRKEEFQSDIIIVSDGPSLTEDRPTIVGGVRGIMTFQITIRYNKEDLHSGNFGGLAKSATLDLVHLLTTLVDEEGRCKIPGFYDNVYDPSELELELINKLSDRIDKIIDEKGIDKKDTINGKSVVYQNQLWPTFNINGLGAGGVKKQRRTIIPSEAVASIDCRLVPHMDSERIKSLVVDYIEEWANEHSVNVEIESEHAMEAVESSLNDPNVPLIVEAYKKGFNAEPVLVPRLGGSLPLSAFKDYLDKYVFLIPYALADENNHAPNENLDLNFFYKGVKGTYNLLKMISNKNE